MITKFTFRSKPGSFGRPFPIDMLRRDQCWPATESDSQQIVFSQNDAWGMSEARYVSVFSVRTLRDMTLARWESFGWEVVI